jgi:hypothetical protein
MKQTITSLIVLLTMTMASYGQARVQVIHNSADAAAEEVDVYINGTLKLDNFKFRTATPFIDLPSGVNINVGIAPASSTSVADTLVSYNYKLASGEKYILIANGIVSPSGYAPAIPFNIFVNALGRETGSNPSNTDVLVFHGSTDAPTVDVVETLVGAGTIVDNLSYGEFAGYLSLPTLNFVLDVRDSSGTATVKSYSAPLQDLDLGGAALTILASGFLNPAANSDGAAFGLWVALSSGGNLIPLPEKTGTFTQAAFNSSDIRVYPNPVRSGTLNVETVNNELIDMIGIFSTSGALVYRQAMGNNSIGQVRIPDSLSKGIYLLQVVTQNGTGFQRIVVQ